MTALILAGPPAGDAHIVPAERLHPVAESYRRLGFLLELNPVPWEEAAADLERVAAGLESIEPESAASLRAGTEAVLARWRAAETTERPGAGERRADAARLFELATRAVARALNFHLAAARDRLVEHAAASRHLDEARQLWAAFEPLVRVADPESFVRLGEGWLELEDAIGHPGLLGRGEIPPDPRAFAEDSSQLMGYVESHFGDRFRVSSDGGLLPLPRGLEPPASALVPLRLPPGSDLNKQLPRPRQILNMASRGVDESETPLIALGDMAFDSSLIFGEPARSLAVTCNTCHNKGTLNPGLFIPGLSRRPGGIDVSNSFFAPHANNGHFDPLDVPDLRGIRFTAPYGRNGRFASLREFTRNVIVHEFNGPEPDPLLLDALVAYMLEFDFLPNPQLAADGSLTAAASPAARRGAAIFRRPFEQMGGRSCASCHDPSDHFLDRRRHDLGTVAGAEPSSLDRALDTPTLLGVKHTAPYFHDGRLPTLEAVSRWFDERFGLGLSEAEIGDLTAYVEAVGDGVDPFEDTLHTLEAELEEFSFFLSTYEYLRQRGKPELIDVTLETVAYEIGAHKWDVQDRRQMPVLDRLAALMEEAAAARRAGDWRAVESRVAEYRALYEEHREVLR